MKQATTTIPIVMAAGFDAVASGLITSLARPGGNITGSTFFGPEIVSKRLEMFKEAAPRLAEGGGLLVYGVDFPALWGRAPAFVDKILKGARPSDLPVERPTRFELVINMKAANSLALSIPQSLLLRADRVIR